MRSIIAVTMRPGSLPACSPLPGCPAARAGRHQLRLTAAAGRQARHFRPWQQQKSSERSRLAPCQAVADTEVQESISSIDIESLVYESGCFTVQGCLLTPASPDMVYEVLTDYESLPRVFHNVESSELRQSTGGQRQLVQTCKWAFLVFSGTFQNELNVVEDPASRQLTFSLVESAFMREFVGSWDVRGLASGMTEVRHRLSVTPVVSPPQKIGDISKKIFRSQVVGILEDLSAELEARLEG